MLVIRAWVGVMLSHVVSDEHLSSDDVYDAIRFVVGEERFRARRKDRFDSDMIDDCIEYVRAICPTVEDLRFASPALLRQHAACSEALERFERIRPLVKVLSDRRRSIRRPQR